MIETMSLVEQHYQAAIDKMSPKERMARSVSLLKWARDMIGRQILKEAGPMSDERLRWEVALRMYGSSRQARAMIEEQLADVST